MRVELGHKDAIGSAGSILVVQEADASLGSAVMVRSDRARCHETEGVATDCHRDQGGFMGLASGMDGKRE